MAKITLSALVLTIFSFLTAGTVVWAHQPNLVFQQSGDVEITNPETSQAFYDELKGSSKNYFITSDKNFTLYVNLLVPELANRKGRYSANIFSIAGEREEQIATINGATTEWKEYYESFARDYYLKGPELEQQLSAGRYKIEIFAANSAVQADNVGRYVLVVGKNENYDFKAFLNLYWQIPILKLKFFNSDITQFFFTYFFIAAVGVIGAILIIIALLNYFIGVIKESIKKSNAKTILLTSSGMQMRAEITKLLQKPAYDITVAFIFTAAKEQNNLDYVKKDLDIMKEMGFNVLEMDIEGKTEKQVKELIELKDIIFVEDGDAFNLLKAMRKCNFEKIMRKLLKEGKVYLGVGAGSIVAGKTIRTFGWMSQEKFNNIKGLNLVPFDVFPHYTSGYDSIIKKKLPFKWQRRKIKFLKDDQAILVQAKNVMLLGNEDEIVVE
jgi:dipeptidase E